MEFVEKVKNPYEAMRVQALSYLYPNLYPWKFWHKKRAANGS